MVNVLLGFIAYALGVEFLNRYLNLKFLFHRIISYSFFLLGAMSYYVFAYWMSYDMDMMNFINDAEKVRTVLDNNPSEWLSFMTWWDTQEIPEYIHKYHDVTYFLLNKGALLLIKVHVLLSYLNFGNLWVNVALFSFISYWSHYLLLQYFKVAHQYKYWLIGILPSIAFWNHAMLKECIVVLGIVLMLYAFNKDWRISVLMMLLSFIVLFQIRSYVAVLGLITILFFQVYSRFKIILNIFQVSLLLLILLFGSGLIFPFDFMDALLTKYYAFDALPTGEGSFHVLDLNSKVNVLLTTLLALPLSLFRPFSFNSMMGAYNSIENFVILFMLMLYLSKIKWEMLNQNKAIQMIFVFSCLNLFVIGFIVRNDGAIIRYTSPVMLLLIVTVMYSCNTYSKKLFGKL